MSKPLALARPDVDDDRERPAPRVDAPDRRCSSCGYGIAAARTPERCPMCGSVAWVPASVLTADTPLRG